MGSLVLYYVANGVVVSDVVEMFRCLNYQRYFYDEREREMLNVIMRCQLRRVAHIVACPAC